MTDAEKIAAFLASKGATKCPTGARAYDPNAIESARRNGGIAQSEDSAAEARAEALHETATEARLNGHRVTGYDSRGNIYTERGRY